MSPDRERTWQDGEHIRTMLWAAAPLIGERKLAWFFVACAETLLDQRPTEESTPAILTRVRAAIDGETPWATAFRAAHLLAQSEADQLFRSWDATRVTRRIRQRLRHQITEQEATALACAFLADALDREEHRWWNTVTDVGPELAHLAGFEMRREEVAADHIPHLRDIAGNPFRPVAFDPAWRTEATVALAAGMYEARDFGAMPVLADALDDAGCDDADILDHCRRLGLHVRGCWVVDLVLGKS